MYLLIPRYTCYRKTEHIPLGRVMDETVHPKRKLHSGKARVFCEEIKGVRDFIYHR